MTVDGWLRGIEKTNGWLARECGVSERTIKRIRAGEGCRLPLAAKVISVSRAHPTPSGGFVTLEELVAEIEGNAA